MSRSTKKGPFVSVSLINKINKHAGDAEKPTLRTWSRSTTILPSMVGYTIGVYNGKQHVPVYVIDQMIGHKLGEFSPTRTFKSHIKSDRKGKR